MRYSRGILLRALHSQESNSYTEENDLNCIDLSDIRIKGDLAVRSGLNFARLEGKWYRPDEVFKADSHGWPGDWEGRVILALTMLEQSTHRTSAYLEEIISLIPDKLNERGYFGPVMPYGTFDEQHFAGNSWIIRALAEYYKYKGDERALGILETMVRNFLMPVKGSYAKYPIVPVKRFEEQGAWVLSKLQTKTKHHAETSDAGCAFIMVDGATAAYELFGWPELRELIDEMIGRFMEMDVEALNIQTHATLSATRGMLRFYEITGDRKYLENAISRVALYKSAAWTESYGNYNWFGAPRWTEPCAIIDSFIVAVTLWKHTGCADYLNDAHLIYYNALSHGNRVNGSFGTDRCCGARDIDENLFLAPINYETYWCCTMRGGEGLSRAIEYSFFCEHNTVYVPFFNSCEVKLRLDAGDISINARSEYPYHGRMEINITECLASAPAEFCFFVPQWADRIEVSVNNEAIPVKTENGFAKINRVFKAGDTVRYNMEYSVRAEQTKMENSVSGFHKFLFGPMLLGCRTSVKTNSLDGNRFKNYAESRYKSSELIEIGMDAVIERLGDWEFRVAGTDIVLSTLCSVRDMTCEDTMRQLLFKD